MKNGIGFCRKQLGETGQKKASQEAVVEYVTKMIQEKHNQPNYEMKRYRLSLIETGREQPTPLELQYIAEYLEVTPGHLFTKKQIDVIFEDARTPQNEGDELNGD